MVQAVRFSIGAEERSEFRQRNVHRGLAENCAARARIELTVVGNRQSFTVSAWGGALEFHVAAPAGDDLKPKAA